MPNYPRTEEQIIKRMQRVMQRNIARNAHKIRLMHRCNDRVSSKRFPVILEKDLCDISRGETPKRVPNNESNLDRKGEMENFRAELDYTNRLNRVEDFTGLMILGNEDAKREILDEDLERALIKSREIGSDSLKGIYIAAPGETVGEVWDNVGAEDLKNSSFETELESRDVVSTPMYDLNTKIIYIPGERDKMVSNKLAHEIGHALIYSWRALEPKEQDLSNRYIVSITEAYEEISADILMKEKFGDHQAGDAMRNQINNQMGGARNLVKNSYFKNSFVYEEISKFRAKTEIFELTDIKEKIDDQLLKQHNIDMNSLADERALRINALTNSFTSLQNLDKEKYFNNYEKTIKVGMDAYEKNPVG